MKEKIIKWKPSKKQLEALHLLQDQKTTELFFGGGAGGGKSYLGCVWILMGCLKYSGSRWLMGRAILKSLKESTLLTFFEVCKTFGVPYHYNQHSGVIRINQSEIYLKDLFLYPSDPEFDSLGSTEYTGAFIDEASQITNKAKDIVMSRIRYKLDEFGLIPKLLITSNPSKNFLYYDFYRPSKEGTIEPYRFFLPSLVYDNPYMSKHYIENLKKLPKNSRERLLNGNFEYDDDPAILFNYDSIMDIFTNLYAEKGERYCTVDVAGKGKDKTVIFIWNGFFIEKIIVVDNISNTELDEVLQEHKISRSHCTIDEDGVGYGLVRDMPGVKGFVNNSSPIQQPGNKETEKSQVNYSNLKSQCWFELANHVNNGNISCYRGVSTEVKELLIEDLEQIKRKDMDKDGKLAVIGKDKIKESIGRSTDFGDSMMMRIFFELSPDVEFGMLDF